MIDPEQFHSFAKGILTNQWKGEVPDYKIYADFDAAVSLLVRVALDDIANLDVTQALKCFSLVEKDTKVVDTQTTDLRIEKIKAYIESKAKNFFTAFNTGLSFSRLEHPGSVASFRSMLNSETIDSMLVSFLVQDEQCLTEQELDARFKNAFKSVSAEQLGQLCFQLRMPKDKVYLSWLLKLAANTGRLYFIEMLLTQVHGDNRLVYQVIFPPNKQDLVFKEALVHLKAVPLNSWPEKPLVLSGFLVYSDSSQKLLIAEALASSNDTPTAKIGEHLLEGLRAETFKEAIPHFNALLKAAPHFTHTTIAHLFNKPFIKFKRACESDPICTQRLNFNYTRKMFIEGGLIIGLHGGTGSPLHLLAYDMRTEEMVWGIPLPPSTTSCSGASSSLNISPQSYELKKCQGYIYTQFRDSDEVFYINAMSGEISSKLVLPHKIAQDSELHLTPEGNGYLAIEEKGYRTVTVGHTAAGAWQTKATHSNLVGRFIALSTHAGLINNNSLHIFGPAGGKNTIQNCLSTQAKGNKLYLVQHNLQKRGACILSVRTLVGNEQIVSEESLSIEISGQARILEICENDLCVLLSDERSPIFVNLQTLEVLYSPTKINQYSECIVCKETGDLWSWERSSCNLFKTTPTESTCMGQLKSRDIILLHANSYDNRLLFV